MVNIMEKDEDFDKVREEAEIAKKQKEQAQKSRLDSLLRIYQIALPMVKSEVGTLAVDTKNRVIRELSDMITIVEKDDWVSLHPHDTFPFIDIRQLAYECPAKIECPFLLAILRKIGMQKSDYVNYRTRMGTMISMEYKRKMGKTAFLKKVNK